jgi:hypothetical protein
MSVAALPPRPCPTGLGRSSVTRLVLAMTTPPSSVHLPSSMPWLRPMPYFVTTPYLASVPPGLTTRVRPLIPPCKPLCTHTPPISVTQTFGPLSNLSVKPNFALALIGKSPADRVTAISGNTEGHILQFVITDIPTPTGCCLPPPPGALLSTLPGYLPLTSN